MKRTINICMYIFLVNTFEKLLYEKFILKSLYNDSNNSNNLNFFNVIHSRGYFKSIIDLFIFIT